MPIDEAVEHQDLVVGVQEHLDQHLHGPNGVNGEAGTANTGGGGGGQK